MYIIFTFKRVNFYSYNNFLILQNNSMDFLKTIFLNIIIIVFTFKNLMDISVFYMIFIILMEITEDLD